MSDSASPVGSSGVSASSPFQPSISLHSSPLHSTALPSASPGHGSDCFSSRMPSNTLSALLSRRWWLQAPPCSLGFPLEILQFADYYKILEVDFDATEDVIRSSYRRLALRWHPDKQPDEDNATLKFQEINEAYTVLSDPLKRHEYDVNGACNVQDYNLIEYLHRFKGLILTCNGLGMTEAPRWY